ncbi:OLC1v1036363C1 [Oldenlandia corymbosa var. corymbosa]|uniref:OLC1v1036363C1 n=1 Tax=Oldenlandia corymbosa var. corymbosa TaxID=529605 RepID=A0AAV1CX26_OLDCO|nr:OLC1v1036363C1 [Oldenlandia corymbosa var. corymbosa]
MPSLFSRKNPQGYVYLRTNFGDFSVKLLITRKGRGRLCCGRFLEFIRSSGLVSGSKFHIIVVEDYILKFITYDHWGVQNFDYCRQPILPGGVRFFLEIVDGSYDKALISKTFWSYFMFTRPHDRFMVDDGEVIWHFDLARDSGEIVGFSGMQWQTFYGSWDINVGYHVVISLTGDKFFRATIFYLTGFSVQNSYVSSDLSNGDDDEPFSMFPYVRDNFYHYHLDEQPVPTYLVVRHGLMGKSKTLLFYDGYPKTFDMDLHHGDFEVYYNDQAVRAVNIHCNWFGFFKKTNINMGTRLIISIESNLFEEDSSVLVLSVKQFNRFDDLD